MKWEDPIVAEVRRVRAALDHEVGYDVDALFRDIRARFERGEFADFQIVRHPPRPAQPQAVLRRTGT